MLSWPDLSLIDVLNLINGIKSDGINRWFFFILCIFFVCFSIFFIFWAFSVNQYVHKYCRIEIDYLIWIKNNNWHTAKLEKEFISNFLLFLLKTKINSYRHYSYAESFYQGLVTEKRVFFCVFFSFFVVFFSI